MDRIPTPPAPPSTGTASGDAFEYGADAAPDPAAIARAHAALDKLTLQAERVTEQRKAAEEHVARLKRVEERLLNKEIPELLTRTGADTRDECVTASGLTIKVRREIRASLPGHERVEDRLAAMQWLIDHGHSNVVKNLVTVTLCRGEDAQADALAVELLDRGFDVEVKKDVNAGTLSALVRKLVAEGQVVPREIFNLFDMTLAKLTRK